MITPASRSTSVDAPVLSSAINISESYSNGITNDDVTSRQKL